MMKKWLALLLSLSLVLGCVQAASALDLTLETYQMDSLDLEDTQPDGFYPTNVAAVGETLYLTGEQIYGSGQGLYRWQEGMDEPELLGKLINADYFSSLEDAEGSRGSELVPEDADIRHLLVSRITTDGQRLIAYNALNGLIFEIQPDANGLSFVDIATMDKPELLRHVEEDWSYTMTPNGVAVVANHLLLCFNEYNAQGEDDYLVDIDLNSGKSTRVNVDFVRRVISYRDGKALLGTQDYANSWDPEKNESRPATLMTYDPLTGETAPVGEVHSDAVSSFVYAPSLDVVAYLRNNRIMAATDLKTYSQYGYLPVNWSRDLAVLGDTLVVLNDNQIYFRSLTADFATDEYLNVYNSWNDQGAKLFFAKYPQVPVYTVSEYYSSMEQLSQAMISGDSSLDVLDMNYAYQNVAVLMSKGYCADLSGDERIASYVNSLNPVYRDAVTRDDKIYAIPLYAYSYDGWYAAKGVMEDMGLTQADLPTSIVELCAFANRWESEWTEEYPQYTLIEYTENFKRYLFDTALEMYLNQCVSTGTEVNLNDPELRAALEAVDSLKVEKLTKATQVTNEDVSNYRQGLFMPNYSVIGDFYSMDDSEYRVFVPMKLTAQSEYHTQVQLQVEFINPKSTHMQAALNMLACKIEALEKENRKVLVAGDTEPVLNPYYDQWIENEESYLASLKASLEEAEPSEKKDYEEMIRSEEQFLEDMRERERYTISPTAIAFYQEQLLPAAYVQSYNIFTQDEQGASELDQLKERYLGGQISLEQFLRDANSKLMMMQMESY